LRGAIPVRGDGSGIGSRDFEAVRLHIKGPEAGHIGTPRQAAKDRAADIAGTEDGYSGQWDSLAMISSGRSRPFSLPATTSLISPVTGGMSRDQAISELVARW
jgi:hypothetical protein